MAAGDSGEKTEKPTPKRLREAREKGQIAKTPDLSAWIAMLATTVLLQMTFQRGARTAMPRLLAQMGVVIAHPDDAPAMQFAANAMWKAVGVVAPMLDRDDGRSRSSPNVAQVGFKPTDEEVEARLPRLNPFKGIKKMVGAQAWWELAQVGRSRRVLLASSCGPIIIERDHAAHDRAGDDSMSPDAATAHDGARCMIRNVRDRRSR